MPPPSVREFLDRAFPALGARANFDELVKIMVDADIAGEKRDLFP